MTALPVFVGGIGEPVMSIWYMITVSGSLAYELLDSEDVEIVEMWWDVSFFYWVIPTESGFLMSFQPWKKWEGFQSIHYAFLLFLKVVFNLNLWREMLKAFYVIQQIFSKPHSVLFPVLAI